MRRMALMAMTMVMAAGTMLAQAKPESREMKAAGQEARPAASEERLRLVFVVREVDEKGHVVNTREYATMVGAQPEEGKFSRAEIRTGARIPVSVGPGQGTYLDVGVNFDVTAIRWMTAGRVSMLVTADLSSVDPSSQPNSSQPVIRQNKWSADEQMNLGEERLLFSSDELTSKNRLEVGLSLKRAE